MTNILASKFSFWGLVRYALPNIAMMVFLSLYTIVDGMFVSRFEGTDALSAVNIVYPIISLQLGVAIMLATGASAIIARKMGEERGDEARQDFSFIVLVGAGAGVAMGMLGILTLRPVLGWLGASDLLMDMCYRYAVVLLLFTPAFFLQTLFQYFLVTAGRPGMGLLVTLGGGLTNIVLDYVFLGPMSMGVQGAALATGIGYCVPALCGLIYFALHRTGTLFLVRPRRNPMVLLHSCTNGSSEMVTNLATAITTWLFNTAMMRHLGEDGVAAITIALYSQFLFTAVYLGYSAGVAPVVSYNYGSGDKQQLQKIYRYSILFLLLCSVSSFSLFVLFSDDIAAAFAAPGSAVFAITSAGFPWFAAGFLFMGINIFASALFTALSDGKVSALLSFLRTFVFIAASIVLLPMIWGINGIWLAIPVAEGLGLLVSVCFLRGKRLVYGYA